MAKVTKVDVLEIIANIINKEDLDEVFGVSSSGVEVKGKDIVNYAILTKNQLTDKSSKDTERDKIKDEYRDIIYECLTDEWKNIEEIIDDIKEEAGVELTRAKLVPRLTALINEGLLEKDVFLVGNGRKIAYYSTKKEETT